MSERVASESAPGEARGGEGEGQDWRMVIARCSTRFAVTCKTYDELLKNLFPLRSPSVTEVRKRS